MERTEGKTEKEGETYKMEPQGSSNTRALLPLESLRSMQEMALLLSY